MGTSVIPWQTNLPTTSHSLEHGPPQSIPSSKLLWIPSEQVPNIDPQENQKKYFFIILSENFVWLSQQTPSEYGQDRFEQVADDVSAVLACIYY